MDDARFAEILDRQLDAPLDAAAVDRLLAAAGDDPARQRHCAEQIRMHLILRASAEPGAAEVDRRFHAVLATLAGSRRLRIAEGVGRRIGIDLRRQHGRWGRPRLIALSAVAAVLVGTFLGAAWWPRRTPAAAGASVIAMADGMHATSAAGDAVAVGAPLARDADLLIAGISAGTMRFTAWDGLIADVTAGSRLRLGGDQRAPRIDLAAGELRIDCSALSRSGRQLVVATPAGEVRPLGTVFEVSVGAADVGVLVHSGEVQFVNRQGELRIAAGASARSTPASAPQAGRLAPPHLVDGVPVAGGGRRLRGFSVHAGMPAAVRDQAFANARRLGLNCVRIYRIAGEASGGPGLFDLPVAAALNAGLHPLICVAGSGRTIGPSVRLRWWKEAAARFRDRPQILFMLDADVQPLPTPPQLVEWLAAVRAASPEQVVVLAGPPGLGFGGMPGPPPPSMVAPGMDWSRTLLAVPADAPGRPPLPCLTIGVEHTAAAIVASERSGGAWLLREPPAFGSADDGLPALWSALQEARRELRREGADWVPDVQRP